MRPAEELPMTQMQQQTSLSANRLRADIAQARSIEQPEEVFATTEATAAAAATEGSLNFEELTETEKSAALIGVSPDDLKPIGFMNQAHYRTLLENNAIAGRLTQQLEAYKQVSGA